MEAKSPESQESPPELPPRTDYEKQPLSRQEYITAMVHFHRAEMQRATAWRLRLDNTTNWAIISVGGLVTFTFGNPQVSHLPLVLGQALLWFFMWLESRRYRYFDVWRSRVRKMEENFFSPILKRTLTSPEPDWGKTVALDLSSPRFKITHWHALHQRFRSNYVILFLLLLVAWLAKIHIHPTQAASFGALADRLSVGPIPWWVTVLCLGVGYAFLVSILIIPGGVKTFHGHDWGFRGEDVEQQ